MERRCQGCKRSKKEETECLTISMGSRARCSRISGCPKFYSGSWKTLDLLNGNAGDDKPAEVVRSRLKKLNADHIGFVLDSLAENTAPVRNMKQYLLAMLYNAPTIMNLYYQNKTNHDFAHGSPRR